MLYLKQMSASPSLSGVQSHFNLNWQGYLWRFTGLILSLVLLAFGQVRQSISLTIAGIILSVLFVILVITSLWALNRSSKVAGDQTVEYLYRLSQTRSSDALACVDVGLRWPAIAISHHLTSGHMHVIDIYNPQLMPSKYLARVRRNAQSTIKDPRLDWYDSNLELLPLPDSSVDAVFLFQTLSELAQYGDQQALLKEIDRILEPNGRLLMAEPANTWPNRLRPGSAVLNLHPPEYWSRLLTDAGFEIRRSQTLQGVAVCIRADKPSLYAGRQMSLDLDFESAI
jgi:SAM-dependent methyltransferase